MKSLDEVRYEMEKLSDVYDEFSIIVGNNRKFDIVVCEDQYSDEDYYLVYGELPWLGGRFDKVCEDLANIEKLIEESDKEKEECRKYFEEKYGTDKFDADWYSDWHKDLYGFRPRY